MPVAVVAVAAYAVSAYAAGLAVAAGWAAWAVLAVQFAASFAVSAIGAKLLNNGSAPTTSSRERRETVRQSAANRRIVYGEMRTGGVLVYATSSGESNSQMDLVIAIAEGEVDNITTEDFWLANEHARDPKFAGKVFCTAYRGYPGQAIIGSLPGGEWGPDHKLEGIAFVHLKLLHDATAFPNGLPSASFMVRGRRVFDPRTGLTAWSQNPALCILDYLRAEFGLAAPDHLIDFDSFSAAANVCDEEVETAQHGWRPRYTLNGVLNLDVAPAVAVESMQTSCAGRVVFSQGKYRLYAGAFDAPVATITADCLRDKPTVRTAPSRSDIYNTVRGLYVEPLQDWQDTDYPPVVDQLGLEREGEVSQDLNLSFTTNAWEAQRLAKIALAKARGGKSIRLPLNWSGLQLKLWDVIQVDLGAGVTLATTFRITEYSLAEGGGVDITAQEERADYFDWDYSTEELVPSHIPATDPLVFGNEPMPSTTESLQRVCAEQATAPTATSYALMLTWRDFGAGSTYQVAITAEGDSGMSYPRTATEIERVNRRAMMAINPDNSATFIAGARRTNQPVPPASSAIGPYKTATLAGGADGGQISEVTIDAARLAETSYRISVAWVTHERFTIGGFNSFQVAVRRIGTSVWGTMHVVAPREMRAWEQIREDVADATGFEVAIRAVCGTVGVEGTWYGKWRLASYTLPL